jgi:hypothetical protein
MTLLDKILALRKRLIDKRGDEIDVNLVDSWYEEAKRLMLLKSLAEHDGVKYVVNIFTSEIDGINGRLSQENSETLPDKTRDRLIDKRNLAQRYLDLFVNVDKDLDSLEEAVDAEKI